ncbi:T9SS type A sorting domain-containing protein [Epilithonimonas sp. JDS]|uniref:T9SS type A sorting domain-containing protein n=1 Tax=Epilithonimonas sp. JDS TaxID=2902797 RepID=UPI001E2C10A7|nr:T9SS type A sorting domain-containing protein [Epilithonimonas sp. JDS]MCD9854922.1 T9SS type A sorting domain-containing protein [Epilithonimonas sp. JDS]
MKKIFTILSIASLAIFSNAQTFTATYDFTEAPAPDNGDLVGSNLTISPFTASGLEATTTGNRFAWTNGTIATAPDLTKYFQVTLTPSATNTISVASITFRSQRSGTGPRNYVVRSSVDNYATNLAASISPANAELEVVPTNSFHFVNDISLGQNGSTVSPGSSFTPGAVTFRIYFYGAEATTGTFSVDDVVLTGTVAPGLAVADFTKANSTLVKNTSVNESIAFAKTADIQIINAAGQVVKTAKVTEGSTLNVSSLAKGMYIVTGTVNGEKVSQKVIKN